MKFDRKFQNELAELLIDEEKISYFTNLMCMSEKYNFSDCINICNALIDFCEKNNLNRAKSHVLYYYGWCYLDAGRFEEALNTFIDMRELVQKLDYVDGLILAYNGLISVYCSWGNYALAKQYAVRGLTLAKKKKKTEYYLKLLINMSITNTLFGAYDEAIEILDYAKKFMSDNFGTDWIVYHKSIAEASLLSGDLIRCENALNEAIKFVHINDDKTFMPEILKMKGILKIHRKEYESAKKDFHESYDCADKLGYEYEKLETIFEWSKLYLVTEEYEKYISMLNEVKEKGQKNKYRRIVEKTSKALYDFYEANENKVLALDNLEDIISLKSNRENEDLEDKDIRFDGDFDIKLKQILYDRGEVLFQISSSVLTELDFSNLRNTLNREIRKIIDVLYVGIGYYDEEVDKIVFSFLDNNGSLSTHYQDLNAKDSFIAYCYNNKRAIFMNDKNKEYSYYIEDLRFKDKEHLRLKSSMFIPIMNQNKAIGVMAVQTDKENEYNYRDLNLMKSIATYIGIAIINARAYKKLEQVAMYDSLTGFLTRREILKLGDDLNKIRSIESTDKSIYIGMIDIDNFKSVNDNFGHVVGDVLLKLVAKTIIKNVRNEDYIGRYGGDEFLIISSDISEEDMFKMLERVRMQIESTEYNLEDCLKHKVTISVGLHKLESDEKEFIKSVDFADNALYKVKKECKNRVYIL